MSTILKRMASEAAAKIGASKQQKNTPNLKKTDMSQNIPRPVQTNYVSKEVPIPDNFLTTLPPDSKPITVHPIDFSTTDLPEYANCYAVVLENVLSASECLQLLSLAEQSVIDPVPLESTSIEKDKWKPAMVNAGMGYEVLVPDYRNSDRIIWDDEEVMKRLWDRCLLGENIKQQLGMVKRNIQLLGQKGVDRDEEWYATTLNQRMRFLRYGSGQFFRAHCDGTYVDPKSEERSFYTLHLYLNDSKQVVPDDSSVELVGGATSFLSSDGMRQVDVDPKVGRVLIFQHKRLYHSGEDVVAGIKYTMRTDLMFERRG